MNQDDIVKIGTSGKYAELFFGRFIEQFCSIRCREVVKYQYGRSFDFRNPEEKKSFMAASQKSGKCIDVFKKAALMAGEIIDCNPF